MKTSKTVRGCVCAAAGAACWAVSGACAQYLFANYGVGELWLTCVRMCFASVLFIGIASVFDRRNFVGILKDPVSIRRLIVFAIFGILFCQLSYMFAISTTNAATATVIQSLGLALIMLYGCLRARKKPSSRESLALVLAVIGIYLVCTNGDPNSLALSPTGMVWGGITAVSLVFYTILPEKLLHDWGSFSVTGYAMLVGGASLAFVERPWNVSVPLDGEGMIILAVVTIVGTLFAYALYLQGIADIGPVRAGLFGAVEPIAACIISATWLQTHFSVMTLLGFALVIVMGYLITIESQQKQR